MAAQKPDPTGVLKPKTPTLAKDYAPLDGSEKWQAAGLNQQFAAYLANYNINRNRVGNNRTLTRSAIDRGKGEDLAGLLGKFSGRGMLRSSGYANELGATNQDYARRQSDIDLTTRQTTQDLDRQLSDFRNTVQNSKYQGRTDAIARRAARLGTL